MKTYHLRQTLANVISTCYNPLGDVWWVLSKSVTCTVIFITDADKVNEICQLETMEARCRWNSEVIEMTSARWGRMKTGRCLKVHPKLMALNSDEPMFLGCSEDVLSILDMKCSSKPACDVAVPNPDLDVIAPCFEDLTRYLEASYTCVKGNS